MRSLMGQTGVPSGYAEQGPSSIADRVAALASFFGNALPGRGGIGSIQGAVSGGPGQLIPMETIWENAKQLIPSLIKRMETVPETINVRSNPILDRGVMGRMQTAGSGVRDIQVAPSAPAPVETLLHEMAHVRAAGKTTKPTGTGPAADRALEQTAAGYSDKSAAIQAEEAHVRALIDRALQRLGFPPSEAIYAKGRQHQLRKAHEAMANELNIPALKRLTE